MKKIICCLATLAVAFGMLSAVTFVKANAEPVKPSFTTAKVSLNENIVLKFGIDNYTEGYTLTFGYKGETYEGKVENGEAAFSLVTPQYLDEVVTATIYDGETKVNETQKSVKEYLYELIRAKKADYSKMPCEQFVAMKTLAVDMLNYGAAAQAKYLEKDSYTLVNADLTAEETALATTFAPPGEGVQATLSGEEKDYKWVSAGIRFDYNVSLYFVVKPLTANAVLKLKVGDNEVIDKFIVEKGNYKFRYENVNVVDFANKYTVTVWDGETQIGQTLSYSVNTYVLNMHANAETGEITKAVYNYGVSAIKYNEAKGEHVYTKLEFAEEQRVVAGEDVLAENLKVNKVCSVCGHSEETTAATYDTTKTFTLEDNTVEVTADGIVAEAEVTVLTRLATPEADIIKFGDGWAGWQIEFDRQATFPESYGTVSGKTGYLRYNFVERIEYTFYKEEGVDLGTIYLVNKNGNAYLMTTDGKFSVKVDGAVGDLYGVTNRLPSIGVEWSRLMYFALGDKYQASTEYYIKAKVVAKTNSLYVDSKETSFGSDKSFTTLANFTSGNYTAPDANMFRVKSYEWDKGASAFELNRYSNENIEDTRLSNVNVAYIKYIIYDTYTKKELGAIKFVRIGERDGYLFSMDNNKFVVVDYNSNKNAFCDFVLVITTPTKDSDNNVIEGGGGLSEKGTKLKELIDYAIKDNIPSDGYYSLGFKGQVIAFAGSGYEDSAIYDYGKVNVLSDLMSNYKPEA